MYSMHFTSGGDQFNITPPRRSAPRVYTRPAEKNTYEPDTSGVSPLEIFFVFIAVLASVVFAAVCFAIA